MLSIVPVIEATKQAPPNSREKRLRDKWYDAVRAIQNELTRAGAGKDHGFVKLMDAQQQAHYDLEGYLQRRVQKLERTLRDCLASDALNDSQRGQVLSAVYGQTGVARDASVLTPTETRLVHEYRQLQTDERTMIRTLVNRLALLGKGADDTEAA